jgi:hypothetical protein
VPKSLHSEFLPNQQVFPPIPKTRCAVTAVILLLTDLHWQKNYPAKYCENKSNATGSPKTESQFKHTSVTPHSLSYYRVGVTLRRSDMNARTGQDPDSFIIKFISISITDHFCGKILIRIKQGKITKSHFNGKRHCDVKRIGTKTTVWTLAPEMRRLYSEPTKVNLILMCVWHVN